jgi:hypothetical protein
MRDDRQQQINNQPLMGVAKAGRDTAVKANAALAGNGRFRHHVDHGSCRKVGTDGRAVLKHRQEWLRQSGNNQLKVMVASSGVDSHGGGSKQRRLTTICSEMPTAKAIAMMHPTPLSLSLADGGRWVAAAAARE